MILDIDGTMVATEKIGKGLFATAYRAGDTVYLLVDGDNSKEALTLFTDQTLPHIPTCKRHNDIGKFSVFSMPFYRKLTKKEFPEAYAEWTRLPRFVAAGEVEEWIKNVSLPKTMKAAIEELINGFTNYDYDGMILEFNKANVSVGVNGKLILRDCVASRESILKKRAKKINRWVNQLVY